MGLFIGSGSGVLIGFFDGDEILKIANKRRIYTIMREDSLIYQVNGPARIELITRYPSPEKSNKSQRFSYQLIVDNEEPITINHRYKLQKSIRSV